MTIQVNAEPDDSSSVFSSLDYEDTFWYNSDLYVKLNDNVKGYNCFNYSEADVELLNKNASVIVENSDMEITY